MAAPKNADWKKIRNEYITTRVSQPALAEKYGISSAAVSHMARRENWVQKRREYYDSVCKMAAEKSASREANRLARLERATSRAIDVAIAALEDQTQFNRYIVDRKVRYAEPVEDADGHLIDEMQTSEERTYAKTDVRALKDIMTVIKDATALMREFYNLPTPAQAEAQRIAAERLEIDRLKVAAGQDADDDETGVVIIPEVTQAEETEQDA